MLLEVLLAREVADVSQELFRGEMTERILDAVIGNSCSVKSREKVEVFDIQRIDVPVQVYACEAVFG